MPPADASFFQMKVEDNMGDVIVWLRHCMVEHETAVASVELMFNKDV